MAKLDVELGKAVGIQRTKAGSGDKEEAFLIRSTLLKFAGAFCLVFLVVGGLAVFLSQWEVSFQKNINLDERVQHQAVEEEAFSQFMQVGNLLTSFLRTESHKKEQMAIMNIQIKKAVDELLGAAQGAASSDEVRSSVDTFSDKIYGVLDEYSEIVDQESNKAKEMLGSLNNILADDQIMPASNEKIRTVKGAKNAVQKVRSGASTLISKGTDKSVDSNPSAKNMLAALGGDLQDTISRVFERVSSLEDISFPDNVRDILTQLQHEVSAAVGTRADLKPFLPRFKEALSLPGVKGIDVAAAASSERQMWKALKEITQIFPVIDHVEDLENLGAMWTSKELSDGQVMHELHKMTREHVLPFEWVTGRRIFSKQSHKGIFTEQEKYKWWSSLHVD